MQNSNLPSLRRIAARGITFLFAANLAAKLLGIITIYVTGLMLTKNDFAIYAIAVAWGEMFGFMKNGGMHRFLLQRARSFDSLYRPILSISFLFNSLWCAILIVLAPIISHIYKADAVMILLILYGISLPAGTIAVLLRSYLLVHLRFSEISRLDIYSAMLRNGGVIILAILGFGPLSFVLPVIAVSVFESIFLCFKRRESWRPAFPRVRLIRMILIPTFWIILSLLAASFVNNGDYMIIGAISEKEIVGEYFFGFQLTVALLTLFVQSLRSVYVSSFVTLKFDRKRQVKAFFRSLEVGSSLLFFIMFGLASIAQPAIHWIWSGKWDEAIIVVQILAAASLARVVSPIGRALLEAQGSWRTVATLMWIEGIGLMMSAGIGALLGGLNAIVYAVAIYMVSFGILYLGVMSNQTQTSFKTFASSVLGHYVIAAISLFTSWIVSSGLGMPQESYLQIFIIGSIFVFTYCFLTLIFKRAIFIILIESIGMWKKR